MSDPIEIILDVDTAPAARSVAELVTAAQGIERAYTSAADKAQAKLDELNRRQKEHGAIIDQNKQKIADLEAVRQRAGTAEQARIDQEIAKLKELTRARQADIAKLEEQKLKTEEKGLISLGATDDEKKALQAVTSQRMIDIGALRDQTRAIEAVRDNSAAAHERISSGIDTVIRKQQQFTAIIAAERQQIDALTQQKASASAFERDQIDQQIAKREKLIASNQQEQNALEAKKLKLLEEQSIMGATSDEEREKIKAVTDARLAELGIIQNNADVERTTRSTMIAGLDAARTKVEELSTQQRINNDVIAVEKQRLEELRASRAKASGDARRMIDQEIEGTRKGIAAKEIENTTLEIKKTKLRETMAVATATSDLEKAAATTASNGHQVQLEQTLAYQKAQANVNETVKEGDGTLQRYLGRFMGLAGVLLVIRSVTQAIEGQRQEVEKLVAAGEKIRDKSMSLMDRIKPFASEMGLVTAEEQEQGREAIYKIAKENNVEQSVVANTAAGLAPVLRQRGITDVSSDRFQSLVGNAARFVDKGMDPAAMADFISDATNPAAGGDANLTGDQLNQQLKQMVSVAGSPARASELMRIRMEEKTKYEKHFKSDDINKMFMHLTNRVAPGAAGTVMREYLHGLNRLEGLNEFDQMALVQQLQMSGVPEVASIVQDSMSKGQGIDVKKFADAVGALDPFKQEKVAKDVGGSRTVKAMAAMRGYEKTALPTAGAMLPINTSPDQIAKLQKEQADYRLAQDEPTNVTSAAFTAEYEKERSLLQRRPETLPWFQRGWAKFLNSTAYTTDENENAAINVYGKVLLRQARLLRDIDEGKVKASPEQRKRLMASMAELRERIDPYDEGAWFSQSDTLGNLIKGGGDTARVLDNIQQKGWSDQEFLHDEASHTFRNTDLPDDRKAAPFMDRANDAYNDITGGRSPAAQPRPAAQPTTQPTTQPVSVNFNNRIVNYGYGYDSVGAMQDYANDFG